MLRTIAAVALLALPASAAAQPVVWVRAETRIELRVERQPAVRVRATLRDDRGNGLPDRELTVRIAEPGGLQRGIASGRTNGSGELSVDFDVPPGTYQFEARYAGDESYDEARVELLLDLERAHVRLIMAPVEGRLDQLDLDTPVHRIRVRAESDAGGAGLAIALENEHEEVLATGTTGDDDALVLEIRSAALGGPAAGRLVVRTPGDAERAPAQTEVLVVRYRPITLTLEASPSRVQAGQPVRLTGRLETSERPLARKAVGLFAGDRHLETVLTDAEGRFSRELVLDENEGTVTLSARFESDAPWRPPASSSEIEVRLVPRGSTPVRWLLAPIGCSALLLVVLWWRSRRAAGARDERPASLIPAPPGIHVPAASGARDTRRRDVAGVALDADEGDALVGARVRLSTAGGSALEARTEGDGSFHVADVPEGRWTIRVEHEGYEAREAEVEVPHRGALAALQVRLRSLRQLALRKYAPLAEALAPERRWWAFWTPRELAERARGSARPSVAGVTRDVEEAVWSAAPPDPESVERIGERASDLAVTVREGSASGDTSPTAR